MFKLLRRFVDFLTNGSTPSTTVEYYGFTLNRADVETDLGKVNDLLAKLDEGPSVDMTLHFNEMQQYFELFFAVEFDLEDAYRMAEETVAPYRKMYEESVFRRIALYEELLSTRAAFETMIQR